MRPHPTLLERLAARARAQPDRSAFHFAGNRRSFGDLWRDIEGFAAVLEARRLDHGEPTLLALSNSAEFFTAFYGIQRAGGVPVPLSPRSGAARLIAMAGRCGARRVVVAANSPVQEAGSEPPGALLREAGLEVIAAGGPLPEVRSSELPEVHPDDLAYIQYTSGSTGEPKGVEIRHHALQTNILQMIAGMEITRRDVFVSWLPAHHDMGLVLMTMVPLYLAAPLFLLPTSLRRPETWLSEITRRRGTFTAAPDFAYRLCLRRVQDPADHDLSSLRVALNAAEPVHRRTLDDFERTFGLHNVMMPAYGLAEATVGVSMCSVATAVRVDDRGFVSVGRPFPEIEIAILADGRPADPDDVGEILVKSPANTRGYWRDPTATAALRYGDGYIRTGDLGYLDAGGELFIVGRCKNLIIHGGRNIAPREVEEALDPLPFVRSAAAVGIDRGGDEGEQVYAFVELRRAAEKRPGDYREMAITAVEAIRSHLGLRPGRMYLVPTGAIPRTDNGKIRYSALREAYLDGSLRAAERLLFPHY